MHLKFLKNAPIGLGTWLLDHELCTHVVKMALDLGYNHIDTAESYHNFKAIGKALDAITREKILISSKITLDLLDFANPYVSMEKLCDDACRKMGLDYLDLLLIHWPDRNKPIAKAYEALLYLEEKGKIRSHGVSNFTVHHLTDLIEAGFVPEVNQVELHPFLAQKELRAFCDLHSIEMISYRCFGKGALVNDPTFSQIARKHHRSITDILIQYCLAKKVAVIPKASNREHLTQNLAAREFTLDAEDLAFLDTLDQGKRFCKPDNPEHFY